ncbi:Hsp20/alpha crystallin family protein [Halobellus rufus]|uniref:Hsp20/alpha crystallin family protein n=1 Tax=Halobellus rufus TaxID=1448860 RepID=UPI000678A295|nr:Hsp20/alpha crystallin family protein [Halobellus rufus]
MSARSNPFEELERLFERMSRQFDESSRIWESDGPLGRWSTELESMAVDVIEHDDEFVVTVDLPGFEREDVALNVTDHTLRIEADRDVETDTEEEAYLRHERRQQSMHRSIRLPDEVDKEAVSARMKNGVLTVTLPKIEVEEAHSVDIDVE